MAECAGQNFSRTVFRATLYRHALLVAPLLAWTGHFAVDYELIAACGEARTMREIHECIVDHGHHPKNVGVLRRVFRIRVSARRLQRLARQYLTNAPATTDTASPIEPRPVSTV
jgi:hypothetical protein